VLAVIRPGKRAWRRVPGGDPPIADFRRDPELRCEASLRRAGDGIPIADHTFRTADTSRKFASANEA
jgi:hypothetical protein